MGLLARSPTQRFDSRRSILHRCLPNRRYSECSIIFRSVPRSAHYFGFFPLLEDLQEDSLGQDHGHRFD